MGAGMIRAAIYALARLLFSLSVVAALVAALLAYGAYRLLRRLTLGDPPRPVEAAAFQLLTAGIVFSKAVSAGVAEKGPARDAANS